MTEEKAFEPITSQDQFNERLSARLAREREKWEKESDTEDLKGQLEAKENELARIQKAHALDFNLAKRGLPDAKVERIRRLVDLDSETEPTEQLEALSEELPELFAVPRGASSGGSSKPVLGTEKPLTREEIESMSESEINTRWDQVKAFLAGQR